MGSSSTFSAVHSFRVTDFVRFLVKLSLGRCLVAVAFAYWLHQKTPEAISFGCGGGPAAWATPRRCLSNIIDASSFTISSDISNACIFGISLEWLARVFPKAIVYGYLGGYLGHEMLNQKNTHSH